MSAALDAWRRRGQLVDWRGQRVFVAQAGRGPALLLIHGYPTGSFDWHAVWDALAERFSVIAPDMLGLGFSDKPRQHRYSLQDHADLHESLIAQLRLSRLSVVAHDLGVSVAQELLARRRENAALAPIDAVVLLNGGVCPEAYRPRAIQHLLASPLGAWLGPRIPRHAFDRSVRSLFGAATPATAELLDDFWQLVNHNEGRRVTHALSRFWCERLALRERLLAPLVQGDVALRLINGAADPNSGRHMAERYRELVPDADIVSLAGIGHWPQIEAPLAVQRAAVEFLDRTLRRRMG